MFRLIAQPDAVELASGTQGQLAYALWRSGGKQYLLYANVGTKPAVADLDVRALAGKDVRKLTPVLKGSTLKLNQGRVVFALQPLQCGAYRLR